MAYKSTLDCLLRTVREEGIANGLFKGHVSTLMRELPGNVSWFGGDLQLPLSIPLAQLRPGIFFCSVELRVEARNRVDVMFATQDTNWGVTC